MNLTAYDDALKSKLESVFSNVVNSSTDKALERSEDGKAEVKLPLISYWRLSNNYDPDNYNAPSIVPNKRGRIIKPTSDSTNLIYKEIPIALTYQIDIWSDRRVETDIIFQELLLYFSEEPHLQVKEDNVEDPFKFIIKVTDTDTDIDLTQFSETGDMYRQIITIMIDNAKLIFPKEGKIAKSIPIRIVDWSDEDVGD